MAEDDAISRLIVQAQLEAKGFRVDAVENGRQAVEAVAEEEYDLVFMDCQMPVLDGYRATGEIRRLEGGEKHTPIVAFTAHAVPGDREKCLAAGMDDYLAKPYTSDEMEAILEVWLLAVDG